MRLFVAAAVLLALPTPAGCSQNAPSRGVIFTFQNNFWVNLHHFVRAESRRKSAGTALALPLSDLREEQRDGWMAALDSYTELAKVSLIFNERLVGINNALAGAAGAEALPPDLVEPAIATALKSAAPIYREHLWDRHRRENEQWIAAFSPKIEEHAPAITKALADAYQLSWPAAPILVDLSCESGPNLAYTTAGPAGTAGHMVISPSKTSEPDVAFEIAFHEASHSVDSQVMKWVAEEGARQQLKPPEDLWHAILFYTPGEVVKRELRKQHDTAFQPYAYRYDLYTTAGWQKIRTALEQHWQPYLDGQVPFQTALHNLVRDARQ